MTLHKPQRLAPTAPPGALLKRLHGIAVHTRLRDFAERDPVYLQRIRQLPCLCCGMEPPGIEAAHVRYASGVHHKASGTGKKPADRFALPLCGGLQGCHAEQHKIGERLFWATRAQVNPLLIADRLWQVRSDLLAMRAVVMLSFVARGKR